jgi:hypothetical protein
MASKTAAPAAAPIERVSEGFENGLAWKKVKFRGTTYHLTELPIGKYDDISKNASTKRERVDGTEYEELDNQLQARLMLKECLVEPRGVKIADLGTRLTIALNRVVNELHYGEEEDQLRKEGAEADAEDAETENEEGERPNG